MIQKEGKSLETGRISLPSLPYGAGDIAQWLGKIPSVLKEDLSSSPSIYAAAEQQPITPPPWHLMPSPSLGQYCKHIVHGHACRYI